MKTKILKKIIIVNLSLFTIFSIALVAIVAYVFNLNNIAETKIKKINSEIRKIESKNRKQISYHKDLIKYSEGWTAIPINSRLIQSAKPSTFKLIMNKVAEKYYISNIQLSLKLPERLTSKSFNKKSLDYFLISGNLSFSSSDDIRSIKFLNEFFNSLAGDVIISNISIIKSKGYSDPDYVEISKKGFSSKIRTKIDFDWYSKVKKEVEEENNKKKRTKKRR